MRRWIVVLIVAVLGSTTASAQHLIGAKSPPLRLEKLVQGPTVQALHRSLKGKLVVLEFWATWCAPCVAAIPHLNELASRLPSEKTAFIAITEERDERVALFLTKHKMNASVALDSKGATTKAFNIQVLPTSVVIAPSGRVVLVTSNPLSLTEQELLRLARGGKTLQAGSQPRPDQSKSSTPSAPDPLLQLELTPTVGSEPIYSSNFTKGFLIGQAIDVRTLFGIANSLPALRVVGPAGLLDQYFSVKFRVPAGQDLRRAVRDALSVVFPLTTTREVRELAVYHLRVSTPQGITSLKRASANEAVHMSDASGVIIGTNYDVTALASELEDALNASVLDETNLSGKYDWELLYEPGNPESLVAAVHSQLGLELVKSTAKVEVLVVGNPSHTD